MNRSRFHILGGLVTVALAVFLSSCSYLTRITIENKGTSATTVIVRSADSAYSQEFPEIAPGAISEEIEVNWPDVEGVTLEVSANHEGGTLDLGLGMSNAIQIFALGTKPTVISTEE